MGKNILIEDLEQLALCSCIDWNKLSGKTVLITGASGLVGKALIRSLLFADKDIKIISHNYNEEKAENLQKEFNIKSIFGDIRRPFNGEELPDVIDYIIHCASITASDKMVEKPVDTITIATQGTFNVLELAKSKKSKSVLYVSSMEVYGQTELLEVNENNMGYLNNMNVRSGYPQSKRLCESLCFSYLKQHNVPAKIARLSQTFGAGTDINDTRVFAQFARSALNGENIKLHTEGKSRGNYCYIFDTVSALLTILLNGNEGEVYNVSAYSATIREMAEMVAAEYGVEVVTEVTDKVNYYAPEVGYKLNTEKLQQLGWQPTYSIIDMYNRMISYWKAEQDA